MKTTITVALFTFTMVSCGIITNSPASLNDTIHTDSVKTVSVQDSSAKLKDTVNITPLNIKK